MPAHLNIFSLIISQFITGGKTAARVIAGENRLYWIRTESCH